MNRKRAANAIEELDSKVLKEALDEAPSTSDWEEVNDLILRSSKMICRKSDPVAEGKRDSFLSDLHKIYGEQQGEQALTALENIVVTVAQIEAGYRDIQAGVPLSAIATLPKNLQISAVIARAIEEAQILARQAHDAVKSGGWQPGLPIIAEDDEGNSYDADGARAVLVINLGATLKFLMGRYGKKKAPVPLILPDPVDVSDDDIYKAGTALLASAALRRWRRIDERVRFWGGKIESYEQAQLPTEIDADVLRDYTSVLHHEFDFIANQRLTDVLMRTFVESLQANSPSVDPQTNRLAPEAFLSTDEHATYGTLISLLGTGTNGNEATYQHLSVAEWVRGYAVLRKIAADGEDAHPQKVSFSFEPGELEARLVEAGIGAPSAQRFLQYVTFGDHSDDLFDCPVLQFSNGEHLLFGPAAAHMVIPTVVLSNLGKLGEKFRAKGPAFERTVQSNLESAGFKPVHIHTFRNGEEYEIDVVLPWQGKLFLIECKTDGLSGGDPVAAYNFEKARDKHIVQIQRQIAGLRAHPDMLVEKGISDPEKLEWIPVLLYLFPYAMPVDDRGVCITDWAGLSRFFGPKEVHLPPVLHSAALHKASLHTRQGKLPTAAELKNYLRAPFQVTMKRASLELRREIIWLQDRKLACAVELGFRTPEFDELSKRLPNLSLGDQIKPIQPQ
ncbi:hypothetical protein G6M86_29715 (plasmid) [Agrobacterium tumefaciens]|uniref:NERD domain-containing protein n=1 Tax=Agrobacterium tumefaciens TaxID=358 RepID=A0AAJ4TDT8_AGRTU|nr:hypothetical protein G6M86_29715 [Agrobacterium tumefaciens]